MAKTSTACTTVFQQITKMTFQTITFVVGFSGIVAQILLLRELLIISEGNELVISVVMSNWFLVQAIGAKITPKILAKTTSSILLKVYTILFMLFLSSSIFMIRDIKYIFNFLVGQPIDFFSLVMISFFVLLPIGFFHGGLFVVLSEILWFNNKDNYAINKTYFYELLGTCFGGILLPLVLLQNFGTYEIIFISNTIFCAVLFLCVKPKSYLILSFFIINFCLIFISNKIDYRLSEKFYNQKILTIKNSVYNNIVVAQNQNQKTFFTNGKTAIVSPIESDIFYEELSFYSKSLIERYRANVAVIGFGLGRGGFLEKLDDERIYKIDFVEKDKKLLKLYFDIEGKLKNPKINIINSDVVKWLKDTKTVYDIIIFNTEYPKNLYSNRYFTKEIFFLVKDKLAKDGTFIIIYPGNRNYLSNELKLLNKSLYVTLKDLWDNIFVLPGDMTNIYFVSMQDKDFMKIITQKSLKNNTTIINEKYLKYKFDKDKIEWFKKQVEDVSVKINTNYTLSGMFYGLKYWNLLYFPYVLKVYTILEKIDFGKMYFILFFMIILLFISKTRKLSENNIFVYKYTIFSTGIAGFIGLLLVTFFIQIIKGYIYHYISLLLTIFFIGSLMSSWLVKKYFRERIIIFVDTFVLVIFILFLFINLEEKSVIYLYWLSFVIGFVYGLEFNLIAKKLSKIKGVKIENISADLNYYDLLGGVTGGIFIIGFLLPVKGILNVINFVIMLKMFSVLTIFLFSK